jgi:lipopolysaccharide assembly protein B
LREHGESAQPLDQAEVAALGGVIDRAAKAGQRYRCAACGFDAQQHYWQCPGCLGWDTYPPQRLEEQ